MDWFKFIHKMWSCSFWTQPQKVVGYHRETHHFSEGKSTKEFTAPQHTRFILPPIHPTKSSLRCVGGIFLLWGTYLENFMSRPDVISTFLSTPLQNRGRNFVRSKRRSTYTSSGTLYLFLRLNNSETTFGNAFWAQRWRARTVPWPQIFNSWKCCAPPGLHICNSCEFWCDLVGACLPQTLLLRLR